MSLCQAPKSGFYAYLPNQTNALKENLSTAFGVMSFSPGTG